MTKAWLKKQLIDQGAHFLIAAAVIGIAAALGHPMLCGAWLGLCLGAVREVTEKDPVTNGRSILDMTFWTLGGATAGWLLP